MWEFAEVPALPVKPHTAGTDKKWDMSWRRQNKICDDGFSSEYVTKTNYCGILQLPSCRYLWLASQMYNNKPFHYKWTHMLCWCDAQVSSELSNTGRYLLLQVGGCDMGRTGEWKLWYMMSWGLGIGAHSYGSLGPIPLKRSDTENTQIVLTGRNWLRSCNSHKHLLSLLGVVQKGMWRMSDL
jgi:hypothetical protein